MSDPEHKERRVGIDDIYRRGRKSTWDTPSSWLIFAAFAILLSTTIVERAIAPANGCLRRLLDAATLLGYVLWIGAFYRRWRNERHDN